MDEWFHPSDKAIEAPEKIFFAEDIHSLFPRRCRPKCGSCFWTFRSHHYKIATSYLIAIKLSYGSLPDVDAVMTEVERHDRVSSMMRKCQSHPRSQFTGNGVFPFPRT